MKRFKLDNFVDRTCFILATVFGLGYLPERLGFKAGKGAGTLASIATVMLIQLPMLVHGASAVFASIVALMSFIIGMGIVGRADRYILKTVGSQPDHTGAVVSGDFNQNCWDGVVGQSVAGLPVFFLPKIFPTVTIGEQFFALFFLLVFFRFFDAVKPFGIKRIESLTKNETFNILFDDVVAAIYTIITVSCIPFLFYAYYHILTA